MALQKRYVALAGVASAAVALGIGEAVALLVSPQSGPLVAVGGAIIDNVPESGKQLAITLFGTNDKLALQIGTIVILCSIAAGLAVAATKRLLFGYLGIAAFGLVGLIAAVTRTGANPFWAVPSIVAAGAGAATLYGFLGTDLLGREAKAEPHAVPMGTTDRRRFLGAVGAAIGGAAVVGFAGRTFGDSTSVNEARAALTLPTPSGPVAGPPSVGDLEGLSYVTSNEGFYRIDTALVTPRIKPADWTLKIHGRVGNPFTITFDELLKRPMVERYVTLSCVSNEVGGDLVGNAKWLGVPIQGLLEEARPDPKADQVVSRSVDGFTAGTPTKALMDGRDALIAVAMNGEPLPIDHGFPARMVVPGLYGYVSATKWLAELELTTFADFDAYWIPRGWAQQAPIKTQSRIDRPRPGRVNRGRTVVAGVAWAPHRGISKVEVQVDDGPWQTATLGEVASVDTWRLWSFVWDAPPGEHQLRVRASDNTGETQLETMTDPAPDGATGWHEIGVEVS